MPTAAEVRKLVRHRQLARKVRFNVPRAAPTQPTGTITMTSTTAQPRLDRVDPKKLIIGANVRLDTKLKPSFVESIREHGVLDPIQVNQLPEGFEVIDGQRRTLGAIEAGVDTVPILIRPTIAADDQRLVEQVVFNAQREDLTQAEAVSAVHQLTLFGLEAGEISKKLARPRDEIDTSIRIATSKPALQALEQKQLTLDQAAAIAEFDDQPKVQKKIIAAEGYNFDYTIREARRTTALAASKANAIAQLKSEGVTIAKDTGNRFSTWGRVDQIGRQLTQLVDAKGKSITPAQHRKCPGAAAVVDSTAYSEKATIIYVCTDWRANGHHLGGDLAEKELTDEQIAEREEQKHAADELAQQRDLAAELRNEFITQLLQRDVPKLTGIWPAIALGAYSRPRRITNQNAYGDRTPHTIAAGWLGITYESAYDSARILEEALADAKIKPAAVALAAALSPFEYFAGDARWSAESSIATYYPLLASWGYQLTEYEASQLAELQARAEQEQLEREAAEAITAGAEPDDEQEAAALEEGD